MKEQCLILKAPQLLCYVHLDSTKYLSGKYEMALCILLFNLRNLHVVYKQRKYIGIIHGFIPIIFLVYSRLHNLVSSYCEKWLVLGMQKTHMRHMATCLAADGIVVNMVIGGEVVTIKSIEAGSVLVIA